MCRVDHMSHAHMSDVAPHTHTTPEASQREITNKRKTEQRAAWAMAWGHLGTGGNPISKFRWENFAYRSRSRFPTFPEWVLLRLSGLRVAELAVVPRRKEEPRAQTSRKAWYIQVARDEWASHWPLSHCSFASSPHHSTTSRPTSSERSMGSACMAVS